MNIPGALRDVAYQTQQNAMSIALRCKDLRNDPEFFEKVCQIGVASLQLIMARYPGAANLSRLSFALSTALMHDFYSFMKQPRQWLYPVSADLIDDNAVLASLIDILQDQLDPDGDNVQKVEDLARECLGGLLKSMNDHNDAYRNADVFIDRLQVKLQGTSSDNFDLSDVDLTDLDVTLRHIPLVERLTNFNWTVVDVGCVGLFMHEWKLLDTAKWAERVGQIPGLQWVKSNSFETWVIGLVCSAFGLKLLEAVRKLQDEALTAAEKRQARWNIVTSLAELTFYGAIFLNRIGQTTIENSKISWLAIFAKSLGLISIASRPAHKFFQTKIAPAA